MTREKTNFGWIKPLIIFGILILLFAFFLFLVKDKTKEDNTILSNKPKETEMTNPASVYCIENNGDLEIRNDEQGNQYGICVKNEKECEEWDFFRGECEL